MSLVKTVRIDVQLVDVRSVVQRRYTKGCTAPMAPVLVYHGGTAVGVRRVAQPLGLSVSAPVELTV